MPIIAGTFIVGGVSGGARDLSKLSDVLVWLEATQRQIERYVPAQVQALTRPARPARPAAESDLVFSAGRQADKHFLFIALKHLVTALKALPKRLRVADLSEQTRSAAEPVRDLLEHWQDARHQFSWDRDPMKPRTRSAAKFDASRSPSPWTLLYSEVTGLTVGGLHISTLERELANLRSVYWQLLRAQDRGPA